MTTGPIEVYDARCVFNINSGDPLYPRCAHAATSHICLLAPDLETVFSIATCAEHEEGALEVAGEFFIQQHPYEALCSFPGVVWSFAENECVLDASGVSVRRRE